MARVMAVNELLPPKGDDWIGVGEFPLPIDQALAWVGVPSCGGVVLFCGTVRDHSVGRPGVTILEYEAYLRQVVPKLTEVATEARSRWEEIGRLVLLHRVGQLGVGEVSVVVATSTPHRSEAFASAEFCINTLKHTVPIWKRETWAGGSDWSVCHDDERSGTPDAPTNAIIASPDQGHTGGAA